MYDWYYYHNEKQVGPIHQSDLKTLIVTREIPHTTLVWKAGLNEWVPANTQPEFAVTPPPSGRKTTD